MPFKLNFLYAASPLTKTIAKKADGIFAKSAYPHITNFTSETLQISTLQEFHTALVKRAFDPRKPCLLKGQIKQPLIDESRKNSTTTNEATQWVCLDMDNAKFSSPEEVMHALGLTDLSYVVQYSSSYRVENARLSCHIFFLLSKALSAKVLKAWLMKFNLTVAALETTITLSPSEQALHWPLDITACQNDKLLYIGAPIFVGMKSPITDAERIKLIIKAKPTLDITTVQDVPIEAMKKLARTKLNQLRDAKGLKPQNVKVKQVGEFEVQAGAGEIANYEVIDCGDYVRFNLNGGDSQAYWHKKGDLQYLHNFKGEPTLILKEVLPGYYAEKVREQRDGNLTPATKGDLILCFQEKVTDGYWWGTWNPETNHLDINSVSNETKLSNAVRSFGVPLPDPVPIWQRKFDPQSDVRVDEDARIVNIFEPTRYMVEAKSFAKGSFPIIQRLLDSAVGVGPIQDHFINWLATIWQYRVKPLTAWILHGNEGCLAGDTEIYFSRGSRYGGRPLTIKTAFEKWTGKYKLGTGRGKTWDMSIPTRARSVRDGLTVGYHEVFRIVESGVKQLYKLTDMDGESIRVTHEHPFMREDGSFTKLCDLRPGDVILKRGNHNDHILVKKGRNKQRKTIHSIPHHPYAWRHVIGGRDYKRCHKARLVYEAWMNGLELKEFVHILRHDWRSAAFLKYLPQDVIVHHIDEDCTNDSLENLVIIDKLNHDQHHAKTTGLGTVRTVPAIIKSIEIDKVEMTYDMTMKAPYHNYVANGFCVSNTGKGAIFNRVIRPLFGYRNTAYKLGHELNEQFNGWMESALIVLFDEIEADMFVNNKSVEAKLRSYITEPTVEIRRMRTDVYSVPNHTGLLFFSNKPKPVGIPPTDRRTNVGQFQKKRFITTGEELDKIKGELEAFAAHLTAYKAEPNRAAQVMQTDDRKAIQDVSLTSLDEIGNAIVEGNIEYFWEYVSSGQGSSILDPIQADYNAVVIRLTREVLNKPLLKISREDMFAIFRLSNKDTPTGNKFAYMLRHKGIRLKRMRCQEDLTYGIEVLIKIGPELRKLLTENLALVTRPHHLKGVAK